MKKRADIGKKKERVKRTRRPRPSTQTPTRSLRDKSIAGVGSGPSSASLEPQQQHATQQLPQAATEKSNPTTVEARMPQSKTQPQASALRLKTLPKPTMQPRKSSRFLHYATPHSAHFPQNEKTEEEEHTSPEVCVQLPGMISVKQEVTESMAAMAEADA